MAAVEVVDEDGDLGVTREQMREVRVGVRVFVTGGAFSVTRFGPWGATGTAVQD
ncbi:hypothetical protein [Streptomyces gilvus]|uniref:hypothetical protein n=1 Tax=Streptomyces gilvus TaxID=2920937 RepID=UPI001F0EC07A|nr:hypothetical protein [Streptomyces sp. CME 23]MCH5674949.1 hypothetical protein [Streptomyces sp. CME 23]